MDGHPYITFLSFSICLLVPKCAHRIPFLYPAEVGNFSEGMIEMNTLVIFCAVIVIVVLLVVGYYLFIALPCNTSLGKLKGFDCQCNTGVLSECPTKIWLKTDFESV